jgi:hypothetical protein
MYGSSAQLIGGIADRMTTCTMTANFWGHMGLFFLSHGVLVSYYYEPHTLDLVAVIAVG